MQKLLLVIYFTLATIFTASALETEISPKSSPYLESFADIVEPLMPSVVNIYTVRYRKNIPPQNMSSENFQKFFEQFGFPFEFEELYQDRKASAIGSGFIIDPAGYIVTNHHLIEDSEEINVKLNDNTELSAKLIGSDPRTDLALLKVEAKHPLPYVKFGDSSKARVGDFVIAIGNPFGLGGTVTTGIISTKSRDINASSTGIVDNFIQTDAAINVGNSGGPMFNLKGEVIGVNTAIFAPTGNNIGIGFSIPSSTVQHVIEQLKKHGKVSRGLLGIKIQELTSPMAEAMNLHTQEGVLVAEVDPKGSGHKAGLKSGDIIVKIGDVKVANSRKLQILIADAPVNSTIKITILRHGVKKELECKIFEDNSSISTVKTPPQKHETTSVKNTFTAHGIMFKDGVGEEVEDGEKLRGVFVGNVNPKADWKGLVNGDMVLSINQNSVSSVKELEEIYNKAVKDGKKHIVLFVKRYSNKLFLALPL
jgi:serine protease Do